MSDSDRSALLDFLGIVDLSQEKASHLLDSMRASMTLHRLRSESKMN